MPQNTSKNANGTARIEIPDKLLSVFMGEADVRGAYGGRGSAKTVTFAKMSAVKAFAWDQEGKEGVIVCGREYCNSLSDSSFAEVKYAIESEPILTPHFDIGSKYIRTKSGRISYKFAGLSGRTVESIKSTAKILLLWADEAEEVTEDSWRIILPTVRTEGSEVWVTWNPRRRSSATDIRFRQQQRPLHKIIEVNWRDNPWLPEKLKRQRLETLEFDPDGYQHIWEGDYAGAAKGAYYTKQIRELKAAGRLKTIEPSPTIKRRVFIDIGGTGASADAFALWGAQFINKAVNVLHYHEAVGQDLIYHLNWMQQNQYLPDNTEIFLPHDGATHDKVFSVSYESALSGAGYSVTVVPNQGKGAANARIQAARRMFPVTSIDENNTEAGLAALEWYHERWCPERNVGLGPKHDWASHAADAFGLMAIVAETSLGLQQLSSKKSHKRKKRKGSPMAV